MVGGGAGNLASPTCAAGQACGAFSGWKIATSGYAGLGPGSLLGLLAFNSAGQLNQQYLYRVAVPGLPQLNQMQTNLDMGNNNVNNAQNISASGQIHAIGTSNADLPPGWGGGLTTWDLHANASIGAGPSGKNVQAFMNSGAAGGLDTGGVVTAVSPNGGNYASMEAADAGASVVTNGTVQGGYVNSTGNVNAQNALTAGGGFYATDSGYSGTSDTFSAGSRVILGTAFGSANQGWGCGPNGEIASNANGSGQLMSCVNGVWQPSGSSGAYRYFQSFQFGSAWQSVDLGWWRACWQSGFEETGGAAFEQVNPSSGPNASGQFDWVWSSPDPNGHGGSVIQITCGN
ncbi:shufflon system plasmid conjugative transfer pilus tip adhesin PilV [Thiomonas sp.]